MDVVVCAGEDGCEPHLGCEGCGEQAPFDPAAPYVPQVAAFTATHTACDAV